jgi:hypothetical protein
MEIPTQARKFLTTPTSLPLLKSWRYDYTYENLRWLNRKDFIFFYQGPPLWGTSVEGIHFTSENPSRIRTNEL